jgi:WD40 repeat protein
MCDNSVQLYILHTSSKTSTFSCTFLAHYDCTEHSLLYSMSIHSSNGYMDTTTGKERIPMKFQVASGTILLDIITWSFEYSLVLDNNETSSSSSLITVPVQYKLQGHEGSIHRVRWSHTGTILASASDDRTLRIWHFKDDNEERTSSAESSSNIQTIEASLVLWGHTGRLWDCAYLGPDCNYIMSVSEDCSYRIWDIEDGGGRCVTHVGIGHRGRGIWQCAVLIPSSSSPLVLNGEGSSKDLVLVTGGADGSVKCWLHTLSEEKSERVEVVEWCLKGILTGTDNNKDWVRELVLLPDMTTLYMATHYGLVLQAHLNRHICKVVHCLPSSESLKEVAVTRRGKKDVLALGDRTGAVTVVGIPSCSSSSSSSFNSSPSTATLMVRWMPHPISRTILSLFWYNNNDDSDNTLVLFSTDLRGELAAWKIPPLSSSPPSSLEPEMIGRGQSPYTYKIRITALAATNGFIVTGDTGGNLVVWKWTYHHQQQEQQQLPVLEAVASLKGALPMAVIRTIILKSLDTAVAENMELLLEIRIGGSEGLLATVGFRYNNNDYYENKRGELTGRLVVLQRERITAPSIIDCEMICQEDEEGGGCQRLIAGYAESSFVVYDADAEAEVARVQAGGWRRADTSFVSINNNNNNNGKDMLVLCHCKGDQLVVHKQILRDRKSDPPRSLHTGHHGREMHAVLFLPTTTTTTGSSVNKQHMLLTGGEDGSIRQLMWSSTPSVECYFHRSVLLGEHPAMATVRALSAVCIPNDNHHNHIQQQQWVLFSAGTRQVLATWLLTSSTKPSPPPPPPQQQQQQQQQQLQCQPLGLPYNPAAGVANTKKFSKGLETDIELRWMSLSAFYHHNTPTASSSSGGGIIFVVAGGSDGSLILLHQGLHTAIHVNDINDHGVESGLYNQKAACWPVAAELHYHEAPILSTSYVCVQGRHLLLSGATNGCIVLWDLTPATIVKEKEMEERNSISPPPLQLTPIQVLQRTHQSGVNALDVAAVVGTENPTPYTLFVVSGGDDQAIGVNVITLSNSNNDHNNNQATVNHVTQAKVECAHSSAVKGIWTDGCHIVSVGLDQRVRRWNIIIHNNTDNGNITKAHDDVHIKEKGWYTSQCIEPAAVDVDGDYIAVAGRGCQLLLHK